MFLDLVYRGTPPLKKNHKPCNLGTMKYFSFKRINGLETNVIASTWMSSSR